MQNKIIERQSNFEILRIFAMFLVLFGHYVTKGGIVYSNECIQQKIGLIFWFDGKLGVSIFALITGFFANDSPKLKKLLKTWFELLLFSILSLTLFIIFDKQSVSVEMVLQTVTPVSHETWWYMSNYIFILALSPFINMIIMNLNRKKYRQLLCILLMGGCIIPTFVYKATPFTSNTSWLVILYITGYYLRIYTPNLSKTKLFFIAILGFITMYASELILEPMEGIETNYFCYMYRLPMFMTACAIVLYFNLINLKSRFVNLAAKYSMGVYLLHDGLFFRTHWWEAIKSERVYGTWKFIPHMIISSCMLYILGWSLNFIFDAVIETFGRRKRLLNETNN